VRARANEVLTQDVVSDGLGALACHFARFLDDVRAFQSNEHKEEAEFHSMEEWLSLELKLNRKRGLMRVRGEAGDLPGGSGNQFSFEFEVDLQGSLPVLAKDLEAMLEEFPAAQ
jgi:hypothetical protein